MEEWKQVVSPSSSRQPAAYPSRQPRHGETWGGLVVDVAKVLVGLIAWTAGLLLARYAGGSNAILYTILWLSLMGLPVAIAAAIGSKFPPQRSSIHLLGALSIWTGIGIFLYPLLAAIRAAGEARPSLWLAFGVSLLGYLIGGGLLMGLFFAAKTHIDRLLFFGLQLTALWGLAGALYVMATIRKRSRVSKT